MSCHTQFQRGLILLFQGCWNTLCSRPCPCPWVRRQSPEPGADEGFGSSARPKANSGALALPKPQGPLTDRGEPAVQPPKLLELREWRMGQVLPCPGAPTQGGERQEERLDAEIPAPGAAQEQAGIANAESGHTVSPSKQRRRCFSAGRSNLGKMKLSIMHLSPHSPLPGWRGQR